MSTIHFDPDVTLQDSHREQLSTCLGLRTVACESHRITVPSGLPGFDTKMDTGDLSLDFVYQGKGGYKKVQVMIPAAGVTAFVQHLIDEIDFPFENEILSEIRAIRGLLENQLS